MVLQGLHDKYVFERRTRVLSSLLASEMPPGAAVLDVGCGDGLISSLVVGHRPDVTMTGVDVLVRPSAKIPVKEFDGHHLPFADGQFDVVTFVDVLHHTHDPRIMLAEAARVSRGRIVIKDHLRDRFLAGPTLRVMDWVGNASHGVALPYNFWKRSDWDAAFSGLALSIDRWQGDIKLYPLAADLVFGGSLHFVATLSKSAPG